MSFFFVSSEAKEIDPSSGSFGGINTLSPSGMLCMFVVSSSPREFNSTYIPVVL